MTERTIESAVGVRQNNQRIFGLALVLSTAWGGGPGPGGVDRLWLLEDWVERGQAPAGASQRLRPFRAR